MALPALSIHLFFFFFFNYTCTLIHNVFLKMGLGLSWLNMVTQVRINATYSLVI